MTQASTASERRDAGAGATPDLDASFALHAVASAVRESASLGSYFTRAFRWLAPDLGAAYVFGVIRDGAVDVDESWGDGGGGWDDAAEGLALGVVSENERIVRTYRSEAGVRVLGVAVPLSEGPGRATGAIAAFFVCPEGAEPSTYVQRVVGVCDALETGTQLIKTDADTSNAGGMHDAKLHAAVVRSEDYQTVHRLAFAITNNLRARVEADLVALGVPRGKSIRILSISGLDEVKPRSPGALPIRQAMEEASDFGRVICYQTDDQWTGRRTTTGHRLHRAWHERTGGAAVLTVPMHAGDQLVALVSIRRSASKPFSLDEVSSIVSTIEPFASGFGLVGRASRSLVAHAGDVARSGAGRLARPGGWGRKALLAGGIALGGWIGFGTVPHRVTVPATVSSSGSVVLTAPFSGRLESLLVTTGTAVASGEAIAVMDTSAIELELAALEAEASSLAVEVDQAIASGDRAAAVRADARLAVVRADAAAARDRLERAVVRAPFDGVVLTMDAEDRAGEVFGLGAPVLTVAPTSEVELDLHVPEWAAPWVAVGGSGEFMPSARPGTRSSIAVSEVMPAAEIYEGRNVVRAGATIADRESWVLPGMTGTARLEFGERRVWWVGLHRIIDSARLRFWL